MLFGVRCPVAIGVPCARSDMLTVRAVRARCACSASRIAFCCADDPGRIVPCAGSTASFF